jgi:hypothetical protein
MANTYLPIDGTYTNDTALNKGWWALGLVPQPDVSPGVKGPPAFGLSTGAASGEASSAKAAYDLALADAIARSTARWGVTCPVILQVSFLQGLTDILCVVIYSPGPPSTDIPGAEIPNPYRYTPPPRK